MEPQEHAAKQATKQRRFGFLLLGVGVFWILLAGVLLALTGNFIFLFLLIGAPLNLMSAATQFTRARKILAGTSR